MQEAADYGGDITADDAYAMIESDPAAVLVDVRTKAEWSYVGVPDLSALGREPVFLEWQRYPGMAVEPEFAGTLHAHLERSGAAADDPLLFLCRSGVRSLAAAKAMAARGYTRCLNIAAGFEGPPDPQKHRGRLDGWKAKGLPWVQS